VFVSAINKIDRQMDPPTEERYYCKAEIDARFEAQEKALVNLASFVEALRRSAIMEIEEVRKKCAMLQAECDSLRAIANDIFHP
jgi:hypothetical protein